MSTADPARRGIALGLSAYLCWGFLPIYFKLLGGVLPTEVVAQRVIWSVLLLGVLIAAWRRGPKLLAALRNRRALLILAYRGGPPIAGALNLIGAATLYGRYWGAIEEVPFLHFELWY